MCTHTLLYVLSSQRYRKIYNIIFSRRIEYIGRTRDRVYLRFPSTITRRDNSIIYIYINIIRILYYTSKRMDVYTYMHYIVLNSLLGYKNRSNLLRGKIYTYTRVHTIQKHILQKRVKGRIMGIRIEVCMYIGIWGL